MLTLLALANNFKIRINRETGMKNGILFFVISPEVIVIAIWYHLICESSFEFWFWSYLWFMVVSVSFHSPTSPFNPSIKYHPSPFHLQTHHQSLQILTFGYEVLCSLLCFLWWLSKTHFYREIHILCSNQETTTILPMLQSYTLVNCTNKNYLLKRRRG